MFGKLVSAIEKAVDPSLNEPAIPYGEKFDDPFADEVEWKGIQGHGSNVVSHRVVKVDSSTVRIRCTWRSVILGLFFQILGGFIAVFLSYAVWNDTRISGIWILLPLIPGLSFVVLGGMMLNELFNPIVFDLREGVFKNGFEGVEAHRKNVRNRNCFDLKDIYTIQFLCYFYRSPYGGFRCFQLNLVLKDKTRITVLDHNRYGIMKKDAEILAANLKVPLWNTASGNNIASQLL